MGHPPNWFSASGPAGDPTDHPVSSQPQAQLGAPKSPVATSPTCIFSLNSHQPVLSGTWRRTPNWRLHEAGRDPAASLVVSTTHGERRERTRASYAGIRNCVLCSCYQATRRPYLGGGCGYWHTRSWAIFPKWCLSYSLCGADAGIPPTLPSTTTKPTRCLSPLTSFNPWILSSWRNKILGRESFIGGILNLEPIDYIWMDFRGYLDPSYRLYT